jgi:hypothetical protein
MQDFIALRSRREPVALVRTFVVLSLLTGLLSGGLVAMG